jgi:lipopolysaccharide/colanic/teichoic acid biosynthesis glycosyltransferase
MSLPIQFFLKRVIDVCIAAVGLILLSPLIFLFVILIKVDSPGPAIYRHKRIGRDGIPFDLYKFRSMIIDGNDGQYIQYLKGLIESSQDGRGKPYQKMVDDPRVTRVGRFLRQYYMDEMPQLWNVLRGEMSLVGPRPHVQLEVDHYTPAQSRRLTVKPGATGLWQVDGKEECSFSELLQLDLDYVEHWSLKLSGAHS